MDRITKVTFLALVSIPGIRHLKPVAAKSQEDTTLRLPPELDVRINFGVYAAPAACEPDGRPLFKLGYNRFHLVAKSPVITKEMLTELAWRIARASM